MALGEARQSWEQTEQECLEKVEVSLEGKNMIDALMWDISRRAGSHRGALCSLLVVTWSEWVRAVCRLLKGVGVSAESCPVPVAQICSDKAVHFCRNSSTFQWGFVVDGPGFKAVPLSSLALRSLPQFPLSTRGCIPPSAHYSPAGTNATFLNTSDMWADEGSCSTSAPASDACAAFAPIAQVLVPMGQAGGGERKTRLPPLHLQEERWVRLQGQPPPPTPHKAPSLSSAAAKGGWEIPNIAGDPSAEADSLSPAARAASFIEPFAPLFFSSSPRSALPAAAALQCVGRHTLPACRKEPGVLWGAGFSLSISYPLRAPGREADPKALSSSKGVSADRFPSSNTVHGQMRRGGCLEV